MNVGEAVGGLEVEACGELATNTAHLQIQHHAAFRVLRGDEGGREARGLGLRHGRLDGLLREQVVRVAEEDGSGGPEDGQVQKFSPQHEN